MEWRHPSVILVTGPPYTAKTSIALFFVGHVRYCMYIGLDEILDSISPPSPSDVEGRELMLRAFDVLCRVVEAQLALGLTVVVDAQLSSRDQLERLVNMSKSCRATKFVVVECRFNNRYDWKTKFEKEGKTNDPCGWRKKLDLKSEGGWFKPKTWRNGVEKLIESFDELCLDGERFNGVSTLVVGVDEYVRETHIVQTVQAIIFSQDDRYVDYHEYARRMYSVRDQKVGNSEKELITPPQPRRVRFCNDSHSFTVYWREGINYEANCAVCENRVVGAAYACCNCQLAIHKSCAEHTSEKWYNPETPPREFPALVGGSNPPAYTFSKNYVCLLCKEAGRGFDHNCSACIFETHLKSGRIPTIIEHDGHDHKLYFWARAVEGLCRYMCAACGKDGMYYAYGCNGCKRGNFHPECALLPHRLMHEHGGHKHCLEMKFSWELKEDEPYLEDCLCDGCGQNMGQEDWFYECKKCAYNYHLFCAFRGRLVHSTTQHEDGHAQ